MKKQECVEDFGQNLVRDGVCLSFGQTSRTAERSGAALLFSRPLGKVFGELLRETYLALFVVCVRDRMSVKEIRVSDWDVQLVFCTSGFISEGSSPS